MSSGHKWSSLKTLLYHRSCQRCHCGEQIAIQSFRRRTLDCLRLGIHMRFNAVITAFPGSRAIVGYSAINTDALIGEDRVIRREILMSPLRMLLQMILTLEVS